MAWHCMNRQQTLMKQVLARIKDQGPIGILDLCRLFPEGKRDAVKQRVRELLLSHEIERDSNGKYFAPLSMPSDGEKDKRDRRNAAELIRLGFRVPRGIP